MTAPENDNSSTRDSAPYPDDDREPTLDMPPAPNRAAPTDAAAADSGEPAESVPPADAAAEIEQAKAEAADYRDKALRAAAELENFRRRAEKEREDVAKYAITNFAREMLPVADNLRRALDSQPALDGDSAAPLTAFVSGVELTERELLAVFERFNLKKIEPLGQPFDHNFHQAMFEIEDPTQPPGIVVQVMQPGYVLKDRLLRPALVGVSKGGTAKFGEDRAAPSAATDAYNVPPGHTVDTKA